jgi:hypothetical protein
MELCAPTCHWRYELVYSTFFMVHTDCLFRCCAWFQDYLAVKNQHATYVPHTAGRYSKVRFRKAQCPLVERLVNSLMYHGRNNGKKLKAIRIIEHAFEIIHLLTDLNPIQVLVDAVSKSEWCASWFFFCVSLLFCFVRSDLIAFSCSPCVLFVFFFLHNTYSTYNNLKL